MLEILVNIIRILINNKLVTSDKKIKKIITTRNYIDYNKDGEMEGK